MKTKDDLDIDWLNRSEEKKAYFATSKLVDSLIESGLLLKETPTQSRPMNRDYLDILSDTLLVPIDVSCKVTSLGVQVFIGGESIIVGVKNNSAQNRLLSMTNCPELIDFLVKANEKIIEIKEEYVDTSVTKLATRAVEALNDKTTE